MALGSLQDAIACTRTGEPFAGAYPSLPPRLSTLATYTYSGWYTSTRFRPFCLAT